MHAEIKEFPGWRCSECGHSGPSHNSYPVKCKGCGGENKIRPYYGPRPTHPRVQSSVGKYGLCHPSDKQWNLSFVDLDGYPGGRRVSVMLDSDSQFDTDGRTILDVATTALNSPGKWSRARNDLLPLIEWLKEHCDVHDLQAAEFRAEMTQWKLWKAYQDAADAESDLADLREAIAENVS